MVWSDHLVVRVETAKLVPRGMRVKRVRPVHPVPQVPPESPWLAHRVRLVHLVLTLRFFSSLCNRWQPHPLWFDRRQSL